MSLGGQTEAEVLFPGDIVLDLKDTNRRDIHIGTGLKQEGDVVRASVAGYLLGDGDHVPYHVVSQAQRRYVAMREDSVIGIVRERYPEGYRVDIGAGETANLPSLSFQGASKRNRPYLDVGALVYARVVFAHRDMEPELTCVEEGSSKSWVTGETLYGVLDGGQLVHTSLARCRHLLEPADTVLTKLGDELSFESVVGHNGRVWIKAASARDTVRIALAVVA